MSDATTPADPTDQIATVAAVLSPEPPIVPASGTKCVPDDSEAAVVHDAQRYDWRRDLRWTLGGTDCSTHERVEASDRLAVYIERLEARLGYFEGTGYIEDLQHASYLRDKYKAERDALLAEHEAAKRLEHWHPEGCRFSATHNNAERVIRG